MMCYLKKPTGQNISPYAILITVSQLSTIKPHETRKKLKFNIKDIDMHPTLLYERAPILCYMK